MDERAWLARYMAAGLLVIGGIEWLLGRVISRLAAAPPLEGVGRTIVEVLGRIGIFVLSASFLLAAGLFLLSVVQFGEHANRLRRAGDLALSIYLGLFAVFTAAHALLISLAVFRDALWLNVTFNLLSALALWWVGLRFAMQQAGPVAAKVAVLLVPLAYSGWYYSVLQPWLRDTGAVPQSDTTLALHLGELAAVLAPVIFFAAIAVPGGRWRNGRRWIAPVVLAVLFSAGNIADMIVNQGFIGVFSIWSVGFTLYLPWPIYAVSLALYLFSVLECFDRSTEGKAAYTTRDVGAGLLLLMFAGYYLQLTYQHLLAVLALLLLTGIARPFTQAVRVVATEVGAQTSAPQNSGDSVRV
jgi:hypothetical protein